MLQEMMPRGLVVAKLRKRRAQDETLACACVGVLRSCRGVCV